jgi:P-type E1-E2 ATPase
LFGLPDSRAGQEGKYHDRIGFPGDGINDGPALKAADVGISIATAVDIARVSAEIILFEKHLFIRLGQSNNFSGIK